MAKQLIMYQDDVVKSINSLKKYLKKMKPTDDYVRGFKDAQGIIQEVLGDVEDVLKHFLYCDNCQERPAEHFGSKRVRHLGSGKVCDKCLVKNSINFLDIKTTENFSDSFQICKKHREMLEDGHIC